MLLTVAVVFIVLYTVNYEIHVSRRIFAFNCGALKVSTGEKHVWRHDHSHFIGVTFTSKI